VFLPALINGPDGSFKPPPELLISLITVAAVSPPVPLAWPITFRVQPTDLEVNAQLLANDGYDLATFLGWHQQTTLAYGSEFRPMEQLQQVLGRHPLFNDLKEIVAHGMPYRYSRELSESDRQTDLQAMTDRGNHKSAEDESEQVVKLILKDVLHGFSLPLPPQTIPLLRGALVQPFGLAKQFIIHADGLRRSKYRLTQDLSYSESGPDLSVNSRIDMDQYAEMIYGWCLSRVIHFIVSLRLQNPKGRIYIAKYDYSNAYRRIAHSAEAAVQSIGIFAGVAYLALSLTFGGSPNPPTWCLFSEMVTDLANEISACNEWDSRELRNPAQPITPTLISTNRDQPLGIARPLAVHIPTTQSSWVDGFIDVLSQFSLTHRGTGSNSLTLYHWQCLSPAVLTLVTKNLSLVETPSQIPNLQPGTPEEVQVVLGWLLDAYALILSLPADKYDAWSLQILGMITAASSTFGDLETLVGWLNHAPYGIPLARHFLNHLCMRIKVRRPKKQQMQFSRDELLNLHLWQRLLLAAKRGVSLNPLTIRMPTLIGWSDSCPFGIGGYSLSGRAWRVRIPRSSLLYGLSVFNNLFKFLGMVINIWLMCQDATNIEECLLALGNNTSAIGWLYKSGRIARDSIYYEALQSSQARRHHHQQQPRTCLTTHPGQTEHGRGLAVVCGGCQGRQTPPRSRRPIRPGTHPSLSPLSPHTDSPELRHLAPSQQSLWLTQVLVVAKSSLSRSKKRATTNKTESCVVGSASAPSPESPMTPSSLLYPGSAGNSSYEPSLPSIAMLSGAQLVPLQASVATQWSLALCATPQAVWLQRFGTIYNQTPCTSKTVPSCIPQSERSSRLLTTPTPLQTVKKPSLPNSCANCLSPAAPTSNCCTTLLPPSPPT
jgi:hypothetical protein